MGPRGAKGGLRVVGVEKPSLAFTPYMDSMKGDMWAFVVEERRNIAARAMGVKELATMLRGVERTKGSRRR